MSEAKQDAFKPAPAQAEASDADRYDRTGWIDRAKWLGVSRAMMAGALTLLDERTHTFSRDQVEQAVKEYQAREVSA